MRRRDADDTAHDVAAAAAAAAATTTTTTRPRQQQQHDAVRLRVACCECRQHFALDADATTRRAYDTPRHGHVTRRAHNNDDHSDNSDDNMTAYVRSVLRASCTTAAAPFHALRPCALSPLHDDVDNTGDDEDDDDNNTGNDADEVAVPADVTAWHDALVQYTALDDDDDDDDCSCVTRLPAHGVDVVSCMRRRACAALQQQLWRRCAVVDYDDDAAALAHNTSASQSDSDSDSSNNDDSNCDSDSDCSDDDDAALSWPRAEDVHRRLMQCLAQRAATPVRVPLCARCWRQRVLPQLQRTTHELYRDVADAARDMAAIATRVRPRPRHDGVAAEPAASCDALTFCCERAHVADTYNNNSSSSNTIHDDVCALPMLDAVVADPFARTSRRLLTMCTPPQQQQQQHDDTTRRVRVQDATHCRRDDDESNDDDDDDAVQRAHAAARVHAHYARTDVRRQRAREVAVLRADVHALRTTPPAMLVYAIDVRRADGIGTVHGLRLGYHSNNLTASASSSTTTTVLPRLAATADRRAPYAIASGTRVDATCCDRNDDDDDDDRVVSSWSRVSALCVATAMRQALYAPHLLSAGVPATDASVTRDRATATAAAAVAALPPVQPAEVNAACGLLAALLVHLADANAYAYVRARLHPHGLRSTVSLLQPAPPHAVVRYNNNNNSKNKKSSRGTMRNAAAVASAQATVLKTVDLYITNRFFAWRTFDTACVALADCVQELCVLLEQAMRAHTTRSSSSSGGSAVAAVTTRARARRRGHTPRSRHSATPLPLQRVQQQQQQQSQLYPPYTVAEGSVSGNSVRHGSVSATEWTRAMRGLLANVLWCAHATVALARQRRQHHGRATTAVVTLLDTPAR